MLRPPPRNPLRWTTLAALAFAAACNCGGDDVGTLNRPEVTFESPEANSVVDSEAQLTVKASARNRRGLNALVLRIGETELARCDGDGVVGVLDCEATFLPGDFGDRLEEGQLVIVGEATAPGDRTGSAELRLFVRPAPTTIVIVTPEENSTIAPSDPVTFEATAETAVGLEWLALFVGNDEIARCDAGGESAAACAADFDIQHHGSQVHGDRVVITARTKNNRGFEDTKSIQLTVKPLKVRFHLPVLTLTNPPRAGVSGISPLELRVVSTHAVTMIEVRDEAQVFGVERWNSPDLSKPIRRDINWGARLGTGEHLLVAQAMDDKGNVDRAELLIRVSCRNDADCGGNTRCCPDTGTCHDMVGSGQLCDCQNPCPFNEGCFPGTCGESPRRCRPGCYPGDQNTRADKCSPQDGRAAHCERLPASEATAENKGGACAPSDSCNVVSQNCPDLPLDRTRAAGPDNPLVPHNCVPASPTTNKCIPVGAKVINEQNCGHSVCGDAGTQIGCGKGAICASPIIDGTRHPARCVSQCVRNSDCPFNHYCAELSGAGSEPFGTGACLPAN